ncbi:BLUF domain-containing protein [Ekhidna sp. To15]|uniref:BLUF domain-containing protein n=1 Tax=Ekhidna sp. To15 TaxID=3395267 RepID=UPI003F52582E
MTTHQSLKDRLVQKLESADERLLRMLDVLIAEYNHKESLPDENLYRLVYTSARSPRCTDKDIEEILEISRRNNSKLGITGILIHTKDRFLQVLEGEKEKVMTLYEKIDKDDRHGGSSMRYCEPVKGRHFIDWDMAGKKVDENKVEFKTNFSEQKRRLYQSMMDGDLSSYKDEGMRVLKTFLLVS